MKVIDIPFNNFLGVRPTEPGSTSLLSLDDAPHYLNHVGTVHASAQMALAEAASGEFLLRARPDMESQVLAVVRRVEGKFKKPLRGRISARASTSESDVRQAAEPLATKGRAIIPVGIEIVDDRGEVGLVVSIEWFVQRSGS
jgi:acyl-coenzyme A thioesterase PaaI-like protein